jgi:hypothetical protein
MRWPTRYALQYPEYQPWFAWHPVNVHGTTVWCEWIERSFVYGAGSSAPIYRLPRDSGSGRNGEDSRSEVEGEASQSGAENTAHRPVSPCNPPQPEDPQS